MTPEVYYATENITVVNPSARIELVCDQRIEGDLITQLTPGKVKSLLQTRRIIPEADYQPREILPRTIGGSDGQQLQGDWRDQPSEKLGLNADTLKLLTDEKLDTVRKVMEYGAANSNSHQKINGIGPGRDAEIKAAIEKLAAENKPKT